MAKTPTPPEQVARQLNVKLAPEDLDFLQRILRAALGFAYDAETVRELIARFRTWSRLPAHVSSVLKKDAGSLELRLLAYLQMLLRWRYEELRDGGGHGGRRAIGTASKDGAS
jgi:hypothetical protein